MIFPLNNFLLIEYIDLENARMLLRVTLTVINAT